LVVITSRATFCECAAFGTRRGGAVRLLQQSGEVVAGEQKQGRATSFYELRQAFPLSTDGPSDAGGANQIGPSDIFLTRLNI
jgi:hypothetical protein